MSQSLRDFIAQVVAEHVEELDYAVLALETAHDRASVYHHLAETFQQRAELVWTGEQLTIESVSSALL